jgi:hypothetical protein
MLISAVLVLQSQILVTLPYAQSKLASPLVAFSRTCKRSTCKDTGCKTGVRALVRTTFFRPVLVTTQPPTQWVQEDISRGIKAVEA